MSSKPARGRAGVAGLLVAASGALLAAAAAWAQSTTTTLPTGPTTTTMFDPFDVSGGGDFEGSFPAGSFDAYSFELDEPLVFVGEVTNGFGGCPGDTTLELRHAGVSGNCAGLYGDDLPCIAFDDDSGIARCSRIVKGLLPGGYQIRVSTVDGVKLQRYFLHVEFREIECGNSIPEITEECDDGNLFGGDCCSISCQYDPPGTSCSDGLFCNGADACDGAGVCSQHAGETCPGPDGDADCAESCSDAMGGCSGFDPNGSPCNDGIFCNGADSCLSGSCSVHAGDPCPGGDGDADCSEVCSEEAGACAAHDPDGVACNDGLFCNGADNCSTGACSVHTGTPCPGADGDSNCVESCNEGGDACTAFDPDGGACNDGIYCNGADSCQSGVCGGHAGNPCPGADGDLNCSEACSEAADACTSADPDGSPCDDGLACNGTDTCSGGSCSGHSGNQCPGPDGDSDCAESCSNEGGCSGFDPNGSACSDGVFCNGADSCLSGSCSVHAGDPCPGGDGDGNCSESCDEAADACVAPDSNGSPCSDGVFCNGSDSCSAALCSVHAGNPCPGADSDGNCSESCNESADACDAADPADSPCNDGTFCNGSDKCASGACTIHSGNPCPGGDGDGDCSESCKEATDACTADDPEGAACNDGLFCNGTDVCASGACSVHAGDPCPGPDGDSNCAESCNEAADTCTAADGSGAACSDAVFCNGSDSCQAGNCTGHPGNPCAGADGDLDCSETCDESADACSGSDPNGSPCDDGLLCNGADTCGAGFCDGHGADPCEGIDGDADCSESCSDSAEGCDGVDPDGAPCDDGVFCNGADSCSAGSCSVHEGSPCPGPDGDGDCSESCDEAVADCSAPDPGGSPCSDGLFCNGIDSCLGGSCNAHAARPCPGPDGDDNRAESCNEATDTCNAADASGAPCSDGLFCNGSDACASGACTTHAGDPCAGPDNDMNCSESCNEEANACTAADPEAASCNDAVFCNGTDRCSAGVCSVHSGNPCPGADGDASCIESCNEISDKCTAPDPNGSACDDGVFCNGADSCATGACSIHAGDPCPGPDGDLHCTESCNEAAQACSAGDPDGAGCDDGLLCNGSDTCSAGLCSGHASTACPGPDGDANCAESCSDSAPGCSNPDPVGSACDDGIFCNGADGCAGGSCSAPAGSPCPGDDGDGNCSESCDQNAGNCSAPDPIGSSCQDSDPCTVISSCNGAGVCIGGAPADCDDHDECTTDACVETTENCSHTQIPDCSPTTTLESQVCGDVNGDGLVKASDALNVLKSAVGGTQCDGKLCRCDASGSGTVTASDALLVLKIAVGSPVVPLCDC